MQTISWNLQNAKVRTSKDVTLAATYKGLKKEYRSTNNVEYEFWLCPHDIKHYVSGNKKRYVLDWHVVPNTWPVKIGTNPQRQEALVLKDAMFQLQQREAFSPLYRLSTIATLQSLGRISMCY